MTASDDSTRLRFVGADASSSSTVVVDCFACIHSRKPLTFIRPYLRMRSAPSVSDRNKDETESEDLACMPEVAFT